MAFENEIMDYTEIVNIRETATPSKFNWIEIDFRKK